MFRFASPPSGDDPMFRAGALSRDPRGVPGRRIERTSRESSPRVEQSARCASWVGHWGCLVGMSFGVVRRGLVRRVVAGLVVLGAIPVIGSIQEGAGLAAPPVGASVFVPVTPSRLADTRQPVCGCTPTGVDELELQVAGRAGVPVGATSAVLTLTVASPAGYGFLTAWPAGTARPTVSSVNVSRAGATVANTQIIPLSASGAVRVFTSMASKVIVDVNGYFAPATGPVSAGRFLPVSPLRLVDTRQPGQGGAFTAGETRSFDPRPRLGVGYSAVAVNVTMTGTSGGGSYVTVFPAAQAQPGTSNVNADGAGESRAAFAIVPTSGALSVFASAGTQVIVDIIGVFTDQAAAASEAGLFVPVTPARWVDTRQPGQGGAFAAGETRSYTHSSTVPPSASVVANVTMAQGDPGYVTAYRTGDVLPGTSTVNTSAADATMANGAVLTLSASGQVSVRAAASTQLLIDEFGWFTVAPVVVPTTTTTTAPTTTTTVPAGECTQLPLSAPTGNIASSSFNDWRAAIGVAPLTVSPKLSASACEWAKLLYQNNGVVPGGVPNGHSFSDWRCAQWGYAPPLYINCPSSNEVIGGAGDFGGTVTLAEAVIATQSNWYFSPGHYQTATDPIYTVAGYAGVCGPSPAGWYRCWLVGQFASREPNP